MYGLLYRMSRCPATGRSNQPLDAGFQPPFGNHSSRKAKTHLGESLPAQTDRFQVLAWQHWQRPPRVPTVAPRPGRLAVPRPACRGLAGLPWPGVAPAISIGGRAHTPAARAFFHWPPGYTFTSSERLRLLIPRWEQTSTEGKPTHADQAPGSEGV